MLKGGILAPFSSRVGTIPLVYLPHQRRIINPHPHAENSSHGNYVDMPCLLYAGLGCPLVPFLTGARYTEEDASFQLGRAPKLPTARGTVPQGVRARKHRRVTLISLAGFMLSVRRVRICGPWLRGR